MVLSIRISVRTATDEGTKLIFSFRDRIFINIFAVVDVFLPASVNTPGKPAGGDLQ